MAKVILLCLVYVIVAASISCSASRPLQTTSALTSDHTDAATVTPGMGATGIVSSESLTSFTKTETYDVREELTGALTKSDSEEVVEDLGSCTEDLDESSSGGERACHRMLIPDYGTPGAGSDYKYP